jgi:hypothetical protein
MQPSLVRARAEGDRLAEKWASAKAKGHSTTASWHQMMQEADTVYMRLYKQKVVLERSKDSTRIGTVVSHAYRAKNKMGALVLDSARFLVTKNGQVNRF